MSNAMHYGRPIDTLAPKKNGEAMTSLVWNQSNQWPESGEHVAIGDTLHLHLPKTMSINRMDAVMWELSNAPAPSNLPPPLTAVRDRLDTIRPSQMGTLQADSLIVLVIPDGTTMLQLQGSNLTLRFHGRSKNFPALFSAEDLISPLRYIASRTEFQKLQQAEHPKMALDEFWLACGGSPEATRGLLQTYYDRVEEANLSFSGLTEGLRTDRGMVHIVFGVPQRIRRDSWNEYGSMAKRAPQMPSPFIFGVAPPHWMTTSLSCKGVCSIGLHGTVASAIGAMAGCEEIETNLHIPA